MKHGTTASIASLGLTLGLLTNVATGHAGTETVTTSKTTTYSGTVSEINPSSSTIILRSEASAAPVTYTYTKETTFVDAAGNVVSQQSIANSPVRIEYSTEGGQTIVRRVVQTAPSVVVPAVPGVVVAPAVPGVVVAPAVPGVAVPPTPVLREKTTTRTETKTD